MKSRAFIFTTILSALACFALSPQAHVLSPPPDGGYPNGNTAEGDRTLLSLTSGSYNSAFGFLSLLSINDQSFDTGVGAGALVLDTTRHKYGRRRGCAVE